MQINNRQPQKTADVSASRNTDFLELGKLVFLAFVTLVVLYFSVGAAVDFSVKRISFENEVELFSKLSFTSDIFSVIEDVDAEQKLKIQKVLDRLREHPDVPDISFKLVVLDEEEPNAFAFPGGTIGVTSGLLDVTEGEIELAFVLGHELGHFHNRDHLQGLGRAIGLSVGYMMIFGGQLDGDALSPVILNLIQSAHSRKQESKADQFGLNVVFEQYGTTEGSDRLFQFLEEQEESPAWITMFSSHPAPEDRIEELRKYAESMRAGQ